MKTNRYNTDYKIRQFPKTRIATLDVCAAGLQKQHIAGIIEIDVSVKH